MLGHLYYPKSSGLRAAHIHSYSLGDTVMSQRSEGSCLHMGNELASRCKGSSLRVSRSQSFGAERVLDFSCTLANAVVPAKLRKPI